MDGRGDVPDRPISTEAAGRRREGIVSIDADLVVTACSPAAKELLGTTGSEPVGESIWDLLPDAGGTGAQSAIEAARERGEPQSFQRRDPESRARVEVRVHPTGDGTTLVVAAGADQRSVPNDEAGSGSRHGDEHRPRPDEGGNQRSDEEHRRGNDDGRRDDDRPIDAPDEPVGVGGWRIDLPSETLHVSEEVLRIRGLPPEYDLTLEEGIQFYHPEDRPVMRDAVERLKRYGETYDLELREVDADGETYWVRTTGVPEYDDEGEITALRGVYRDITERKEREFERERQTREVVRQNERLDRFARVVSHDLRNPLAVARGRLEMAREQVDGESYEAIEHALSRIDTLIEDVLELARHGTTVRDPEPVAIAPVLDECLEAVEAAEARLVVEDDVTVVADRSRLRQLLGNLVRNAVEHGGDAVTVTIGRLEDGFYVEDDGPGISPERRESVFESGYSTSSTGTGFGLPIVREIAQAHHWDVHVADGVTGGARFEVTGVELV